MSAAAVLKRARAQSSATVEAMRVIDAPAAVAREQKVSQAAVRIVFEDLGQDFLVWDVTEHGTIVECGPFQSGVWCGQKVLNPRGLAVGGPVSIENKSVPGTASVMRYRVRKLIDLTMEGRND